MRTLFLLSLLLCSCSYDVWSSREYSNESAPQILETLIRLESQKFRLQLSKDQLDYESLGARIKSLESEVANLKNDDVQSSSSLNINSIICGGVDGQLPEWQLQYSLLFQDIISSVDSGALPSNQRYLVSIPVKGGFADMLHNVMTGFLWSLLSRRAFLILHIDKLEKCEQRSLEFGYEPKNFNWSHYIPSLNVRTRYQCLLPPYRRRWGERDCKEEPFKLHGEASTHESSYQAQQDLNSADVMRGFIEKNGNSINLETLLGDKDVVAYVTNRGATYNIFNNDHHQKTLLNYGLNPQTAFPCIFHFLFKQKPDVCSSDTCVEIMHLLQDAQRPDSNTVTIGVQSRINPRVQSKAGLDAIVEHVYCLDSLLYDIENEGKQALIVLITIDTTIQTLMKAKYGDRLFLPGEVIAIHERGDMANCSEQYRSDRQSVLDSQRDMFLLSLTHKQIVTRDSGLGILGAMMGLRQQPIIYRMPLTDEPTLRMCNATPNGDAIDFFANSWSGL